jgi:hypothetical protein
MRVDSTLNLATTCCGKGGALLRSLTWPMKSSFPQLCTGSLLKTRTCSSLLVIPSRRFERRSLEDESCGRIHLFSSAIAYKCIFHFHLHSFRFFTCFFTRRLVGCAAKMYWFRTTFSTCVHDSAVTRRWEYVCMWNEHAYSGCQNLERKTRCYRERQLQQCKSKQWRPSHSLRSWTCIEHDCLFCLCW